MTDPTGTPEVERGRRASDLLRSEEQTRNSDVKVFRGFLKPGDANFRRDEGTDGRSHPRSEDLDLEGGVPPPLKK